MGDEAQPVEVPYTALSGEALERLAEEFVTRDGTDYGAIELELAEKVDRLRGQLESGDARIFFDPETETVNVVATRELRDVGPDR